MDSLTSFTTSPSFTSQSAMANPDYVTFGSFRPASCWSWHNNIEIIQYLCEYLFVTYKTKYYFSNALSL